MDTRNQQVAAASAGALVAVPLLWHFGGKALRNYFRAKYTVAYDIPQTALEREAGEKIKGTAVICGGSVGGLLSARICANHFEDVVIIEPEVWTSTRPASTPMYGPDGEVLEGASGHKRSRVQQYLSIHAYLPIILELSKTLYPGFDKQIINSNGRILKHAIHMQHRDGAIFRETSDFEVMFTSRENFERNIRNETLKFKNIRQIVGTATGIKASEKDLCRLNGVHVRLADGTETYFPASLVVDCSGPAQAGFKWLSRLFRDVSSPPQIPKSIPFEEMRIEYNTNDTARRWNVYVPAEVRSRLPNPQPYEKSGWVYSYLPVPGEDFHAFVINRIEGHRFEIATTARNDPGSDEHKHPKTPDDLIPWLRNISHLYKIPEWVFEFVKILLESKDAWEDLGIEPSMTFSTVRFSKAPFLPHNFIAIGDSYMRVNPVYAQGTSKAGACAVILDALLRRKDARTGIPDGLGRHFADVHAQKLDNIWNENKISDYMNKTTTPVKGEDLSLADNKEHFVKLLLRLSIKDDFVDRQLSGVRSFLHPPQDLFHPKLLLKLGWFWFQTKVGLA